MTDPTPQTLPDSREAFEAYLDGKVHESDVATRRDLWPFSDTRPIHAEIFNAGWQAALATAGEATAAPDEKAVFEKWLRDTCPSGDVESVQYQWEQSSEYSDFLAQSAPSPAAPGNGEEKS